MSDVRPFRFEIPDSALNELKRRLAETRWPERETPKDWSQGVPLAYTQEVCEYWRTRYDWRRCEARLNALPEFITTIDGVDIQFIHLRSKHEHALPMIVTHGWPGSVIEFLKVLGPLTDPTAHGGDAADAFHVVCPTLPGFGFSGKPTAPGWGVERIGRVWGQLMARLGYGRYVAQGGDWGSIVTHSMGLSETEHCIAMHSNMPMVMPSEAVMKDLTEQEKSAARRPPTLLGLGLRLLQGAEHSAADRRLRAGRLAGRAVRVDPREVLELDRLQRPPRKRPLARRDARQHHDVLAAGLRGRLLRASTGRASDQVLEPKPRIQIPVGASIFPHEIIRASKRWCEERYAKLIHYNVLDKGGHFAAFEQPGTFVNELRTCFRNVR